VEFHEVGALDAIVDVVGTALGFIHLGIETVHVSALPLGHGLVQTAHGPLPVPGPAVLALLRGWPVRAGDGNGELVTPTGAAIVAGLGHPETAPPFPLAAGGVWARGRTLTGRPNLLRILLRDPTPAPDSAHVA